MRRRKNPAPAAAAPLPNAVVRGATFSLDYWAVCALVFAVLGTALFVDPNAHASFDAPKRGAALLGATAAALLLLRGARLPRWNEWSALARDCVAATAFVALALIAAAIASPFPDQTWPVLRRIALMFLFVPLAAALDERWMARIAIAAAAGAGINAAMSLLQAAGMPSPVTIAQLGGRYATGALLGNEGYVALASALGAAFGLALAIVARSMRLRACALGGVLLGVAAIAVNRQLTAGVALVAAGIVIVTVRWRLRSVLAIGAAGLALLATSVALPALRDATWARVPLSTYQQITTDRIGGWAAALDMAAERPLLGYGPGTFATQAQTHRLAVELRWRERLPPPAPALAVVYAHDDYLQLAAEAGVPALLAGLAALACLIVGLARLAWSRRDAEPLALLGVVVAGSVAALAWFPLQIPYVAVVLLLTAGRGWRLVATPTETAP